MKNNPTKKEACIVTKIKKRVIESRRPENAEGQSLTLDHLRLRDAMQDAMLSQVDAAFSALVAGQVMQEKCASLVIKKTGTNAIQAREARKIFSRWLHRNLPHIPLNSAYVLMSGASHLVRLLLEIRGQEQAETPIWFKCGENHLRISDVLTMEDSECSQPLLTFRETLETFLSDWDSVEDATCWFDGQSSATNYPSCHPKSRAIQPANPPLGTVEFLSINISVPAPIFADREGVNPT